VIRLLAVPGDGIGPEIMVATLKVVDALGVADLVIDTAECGLGGLERYGTTVRQEDLDAARAADGVILGPMSVKDYPLGSDGGRHVPAVFRQVLDLHSNIRPSRTIAGVPSAVPAADLVLVRENLEGFYADRNMSAGTGEFMPTPDVALAVGKFTVQETRRVARTAFELARRRSEKRVTIVHKAPALRLSHKLFIDTAREVGREYPDVTIEDQLVDAVAALLVRVPERFDVLLTPNMFGDILSDEAAELCGGVGLAASLNVGDGHAVAQAAHGSAPDIAGRDIANPTSLMQSVALLFDHLGSTRADEALVRAGERLRRAVDERLSRAATRTRDLGGHLGTAAFADAVVEAIEWKSEVPASGSL
jgi:isocitrate/isopropylmalate dehydrogenase